MTTTGSVPDPSPDEVLAAVQKTGFLLEQQVYRTLLAHGFDARVSVAYEDTDKGESKSREIDVYGHKTYYTHPNGRASFVLKLIVECKKHEWPYVVVARNSTEVERTEMPFGASFWTKYVETRREAIQDPYAGNFRVYSSNVWNILGLATLPGSPTGSPVVGNQLLAMDRNKQQWSASNDHMFTSVVVPMAKAVKSFTPQPSYSSGQFDPTRDYSTSQVIFPLLVTTSKIFEINADDADMAAVERPWATVVRELKMGDLDDTIRVTVVQATSLDAFIDQVVDAFGFATAKQIAFNPDILIVRQLEQLPSGSPQDHFRI